MERRTLMVASSLLTADVMRLLFRMVPSGLVTASDWHVQDDTIAVFTYGVENCRCWWSRLADWDIIMLLGCPACAATVSSIEMVLLEKKGVIESIAHSNAVIDCTATVLVP